MLQPVTTYDMPYVTTCYNLLHQFTHYNSLWERSQVSEIGSLDRGHQGAVLVYNFVPPNQWERRWSQKCGHF